MLLLGIIGSLEGIAMAKRDQQRPGWTDLLGSNFQQLQNHSADSVAFKLCCDQTHGLIADGSDRYQQSHIDTIFDQKRHSLGQVIPK